jgi:hypothetical protein
MRFHLRAGAAVVILLALAGCGRLNRTATINQVKQTAGAAVALALQQQLANHGLPNAHVECAKNMILNTGTTTSCALTGAGSKGAVRFTFKDSSGAIDPGSVKAS